MDEHTMDEHTMDEYTMTWSDASRFASAPRPGGGGRGSVGGDAGYGTLGRALWSVRCLAGVLALAPDVRREDARKLVAGLSSHPRWLQVEPGEAAARIHAIAAM